MTVKLGFLGLGIMGERLLRAALNHDPAVICPVGAFDPAPGTADKLRAIDPSLETFATPEDAIAGCDCLHIASPPQTHLAYLRACSDAGKAALCEKPLAIDVAASRQAVTDAERIGLRAAVNFPFASSFAVDQLVSWYGDGQIGDAQRIDVDLAFADWPRSWQRDAISWLDGPEQGGFTREVASHFVFLSLRLGGQLSLEQAACDYPEPGRSERAMSATLTAGALPMQLNGRVGQTQSDDHNSWTVQGTHGRMRLRDWSFAELEVDGAWQAPADAMPNVEARPKILARQLDKAAAMTRGQTTDLPTLNEALQVQEIVEDILRSPVS